MAYLLNYLSAFATKSNITISAACTTVHNCMQQLRRGKTVWFLFLDLTLGETYSTSIDRQTILLQPLFARELYDI